MHTPQELLRLALLGQRARGRLHHAGYSACPGSLRDPISKWSGLLARCLSEAGRVRAARGRPSVLAERRRHRRSAAAMACGWRGLQFAGAQDSIAYLYALWQATGAARRPAHLPLWTTGLRRDFPNHINVILSDLWDTKCMESL